MSLLFDTLEEFDEEIEFVRTQIRNAVKATDFSLDTNQSKQRVTMNLKEIRLYLKQLIVERQAFYERSIGAGVTSVTVRRFG